jgi:TATA-box binding protein (TBP) (component of TFIID and TFIIIB)
MKLDKCIYIKNIVCTFKIKFEENFDNILEILNDVAYKPKKYHGIIIRNDEFGIKFMFFKGGSVNAVGIKSIAIFEKVGDIFIDIFKKKGIDVSIISNPRITNIVATANVHSKINLAIF